MKQKKCSSCQEIKNEDEFPKTIRNNDGIFGKCKVCFKELEDAKKSRLEKVKISEKPCTKCKNIKQISEFPLIGKKQYIHSWCRGCCNAKRPDRIDDEYDKLRKTLNKYGLTVEEYQGLLEQQNGVCGICKKEEKVSHNGVTKNRLCIDHCHKTNIIRGLLCSTCNAGLGNFYDKEDLLISAANYLLSHKGKDDILIEFDHYHNEFIKY